MTIPELLADRRLVLCLGGGGVGKTSIAAALGLMGARGGRRALVLTVDPARRLASALGLEHLADEPHAVAPCLDAMMLDRKRAWDRLVARHVPDVAARDRILESRLYGVLSQAFAGAYEYLALEEIVALSERGTHDLVVVDTPPSRHAFELLGAPGRLAALLDRRFLRWLFASRLLARELDDAAGTFQLGELADLLGVFAGLFSAFRERAEAARRLLAGPEAAIVLVVAPDERGVADGLTAADRLRALELTPALVVANRAHPPLPPSPPDPREIETALAQAGIGGPGTDWLVENYLAHARLTAGEAARLRPLEAVAPLFRLPRLEGDVHDLASLGRLAEVLAA